MNSSASGLNVVGCCVLALVILLAAASESLAQPTYRVTDLGVFPTGTGSEALGLNGMGQVVGAGDKDQSFYTRAVLWTDSEMLDLTGLGISGAAANAVNNAGQVVGYSDEFDLNAFVWQDAELTPLPHPLVCCSVAHDINESGQIVGYASLEQIGLNHAVLWENAELTDLGTLGGIGSFAYAINESGQIVGSAGTASGFSHPFFWQDGEMIDLGTFGGDSGYARGINAQGHVAGYAYEASGAGAAFVWRGGELINLGRLPGGFYSYGHDINDDDWIVGSSYGSGFMGLHATLWIDDSPIDLNTLIDPASPWTLQEAMAINNAGHIVGAGRLDGQTRAFLLTPCGVGDLDCDGSVGAADLAALLGSWGVCDDEDDCSADLDGDGMVGAADLAVLLGNWGPS